MSQRKIITLIIIAIIDKQCQNKQYQHNNKDIKTCEAHQKHEKFFVLYFITISFSHLKLQILLRIYNSGQNIWNKKKLNKIGENQKTLIICLCVIFNRYYQNLFLQGR